MLLALSLALAPAHAETALVMPSSVLAINPGAEAEDVPVDTLPVVGFRANQPTSAVVRLTEAESGTVLVEETLDFEIETRLVTLDPGGLLAADTQYRVDVVPDLGSEVSATFTTGSGVAVEVAAPALRGGENLTFDGAAAVGTITMEIDPETSSLATFVVVDTATGAVAGIEVAEPGDATHTGFVSLPMDANPSEVCLQAVSVDLAGREAEGPTVCYEVRTRGFGCASAPGPMAVVAVGMALALGLARRRG